MHNDIDTFLVLANKGFKTKYKHWLEIMINMQIRLELVLAVVPAPGFVKVSINQSNMS